MEVQVNPGLDFKLVPDKNAPEIFLRLKPPLFGVITRDPGTVRLMKTRSFTEILRFLKSSMCFKDSSV